MTDTSNNGSGANAGTGETTAAAKPKVTRKPSAGGASAAQTSTMKKATMADEPKTTTGSGSMLEEGLRERLQDIETRARELQRWAATRQEMAREVVEERPLAVVGAAFGVGLLLGLVVSRL